MGNFSFTETGIDGLYIVEAQVFGDERGYLMETYNQAAFSAAGLEYRFVQENQSRSVKGVLRGLHFQRRFPQAKLVRVLSGQVYDVALDLRPGSESFGRWFGLYLSAENRRQFLIPRGFAHGFLVTSEQAEFAYLCDEFYHPEDEGGIIYSDPALAIAWPDAGRLILSEKDKKHPRLSEAGIIL
ncbi:MAG: dTDP-4-dehydrorhamnose 3,5-epimerase [Oscillospiraceae bacterium]|nr:dTDP-4-dehydrorhamnose 3,5-epimerase [Oscillospiraceae bacterium]